MVWLLENEQTGWSYSGAADGDQVRGNRVHVSADTTINYVSFLWPVNDTAYLPVAIKVWDESSTLTPVINVSSIPTPSAQGWVFQTITPVTLLAGHDYTVAWIMAAGTHVSWKAGAVPTAPPSPFSWLSPAHKWAYHSTAFPTQTDDVNYYAVGVSTDVPTATSGTGGQIVSTTDLQDALADWLISTSDNQHQTDGLPWLIHEAVKAGGSLATDIQNLSDSLAHTLQMASDWLASGSSTIFTDLKNRILGASGGGGSAFYGSGGTQVAQGVEDLLARPAAVAPSNAAPGTFPGTGWTMTAEEDFTICDAFAEPADLYVITCDAATIAPSPVTICGVDWYPHLLWHAILNGDFLQERRFGDFAKLHVTDGGRRMPGLFVKVNQGGDGHIQAWTYTP